MLACASRVPAAAEAAQSDPSAGLAEHRSTPLSDVGIYMSLVHDLSSPYNILDYNSTVLVDSYHAMPMP